MSGVKRKRFVCTECGASFVYEKMPTFCPECGTNGCIEWHKQRHPNQVEEMLEEATSLSKEMQEAYEPYAKLYGKYEYTMRLLRTYAARGSMTPEQFDRLPGMEWRKPLSEYVKDYKKERSKC